MIKLKDGFSGERALVLPQITVKMMEDDPLLSVLHITDIGYYPKAQHHFRERKEPVNQYVFIYCILGRFTGFISKGRWLPIMPVQYSVPWIFFRKKIRG